MSEAKHTPGPWTAEQTDEEALTGEWTIWDADDHGLIAEVPNPYTTYEMQVAYATADNCPMQANAQLLAAAPELVAALKKIAGIYNPADYREGSQERHVGDIARAALTRATT